MTPLPPLLQSLLAAKPQADSIDVKIVSSEVSLRKFIAGFLNYFPFWLRFLYQLRAFFVRLFGMRQDKITAPPQMFEQDVPMLAGTSAGFFTVLHAKEEEYWLVEINDSHLSAILGVVVTAGAGTQRKFQVYTIVYYHNWKGSLYFNIIRPLHHWVVWSMARAAAKS